VTACAVAGLMLLAAAGLADDSKTGLDPIAWKAGELAAAAAPEANPEAVLAAGTSRHVVVQFDALPLADRRRALAAGGVRLQRYLGANAYFARLRPGARASAAASSAGVRAVLEPTAQQKLHPMLLAGDYPSYARALVSAAAAKVGKQQQAPQQEVDVLAVYVLFHPDVDLSFEGIEAVLRHGGVVRDTMGSINGVVAWVPQESIGVLAAEDAVQWIEPPLPPMTGTNDSNRARVQADIVNAPPYSLDGTGVNVLVYDAGTALDTHADFGGRLTVRDYSGVENHSTHVAGTIGGDGSASGGRYRGMAPGVVMQSYGFEYDGTGYFLYTNPGDLEDDYGEAINIFGAEIANNSIGSNVSLNSFPCEFEGSYGVTSMLIDQVVCGSLGAPTRIIWANGNERQSPLCLGVEGFDVPYHSTAPPACAKNHITVGAVNSNDDSMTTFSSFGPTDDGRLKPDVSAPGCQNDDDGGVTSTMADGGYDIYCGTSMAAPTVTGVGALIIEDFKQLLPHLPLPRNSTLKILLAHNAVDLGNAGPDYQFGYGSVRAQASIDFLRHGDCVVDAIDHAQQRVYYVRVAPGASVLKATLAWDDPPGAINTTPELVNDLDIVAIAPGGSTHYPWKLDSTNPAAPAVRNQPDRVNNIEQVLVNTPAEGMWQIRITGYAVAQGPQVFSLLTTPSSASGRVSFGDELYACEAIVCIVVHDADLNAAPGAVETATVIVSSTSEPAGESVQLTELNADSPTFVGTLSLSQTNAAGVLQVTGGDTITARYDDAEDGSGSSVVVTGQAAVECTAPAITNIVVTDIGGRTATVTFDTDEPTAARVRCGSTCGGPYPITGQCLAPRTSHSIRLTGLDPLTSYRFVVDAWDVAGNLTSDDGGGACHSFMTTDLRDYFAEQFLADDNDLDNLTVIFTPNGSADVYTACVEPASAFPTDPAGGTPLGLDDDDFALVVLSGGATVKLYGSSYSLFYIGSNGYITFGAGDFNMVESPGSHFALPRVAALFDDLNPAFGGTVSYRQLADRVAVTFQNVPEYFINNSNNFQIELFFNGVIRITWLLIAAQDGLAGLSQGGGVPLDFEFSDLGAYASCADGDGDGVPDAGDNCPGTYNPTQDDGDGDGAGDLCDLCPGTPSCASVDADGCPSDADGDGVLDGCDQCPSTPACASVNANGCPSDADGDGVLDGCDQCPSTPSCASVDAEGCPSDADGDGVLDGCDQCPSTPSCATVDTNGCPNDSDGDGVLEGCDRCPNTPACASADADGCPGDVDDDGVFDGCDQCEGTPTGDPVDADGCSTADDDGDGVPNDDDACPGTPACATHVNARGCELDSDSDGVADGCPPRAQEQPCCGSTGPIAPLALAVGLLLFGWGTRRARHK